MKYKHWLDENCLFPVLLFFDCLALLLFLLVLFFVAGADFLVSGVGIINSRKYTSIITQACVLCVLSPEFRCMQM